MRMRPCNFPTIRLAQLAQVIHKNGCLFSKIREATNVAEVKALFDVEASGYWETHYRFTQRLPQCERLPQCDSPTIGHVELSDHGSHETKAQSSRKTPKHLGNSTADLLIINAVVPLLFCYGRLHKNESVCETAIRFLEETEAEDNAIIRHYTQCGIMAENAMQSQALLHLYNIYCKRKRCLECRLGNVLLR